MGEELVDGEIVVAPREMCCRPWFLSCSGRACYGIDSDVVDEESGFCQWEETELNAGGEATRVGQMEARGNVSPVYLGQTVDVVVVTLDAEVLRKVNYLDIGRYGVFLEECFALAMAKAEEDDIDLVEGHLRGEPQFGVAHEAFVDIVHFVASI